MQRFSGIATLPLSANGIELAIRRIPRLSASYTPGTREAQATARELKEKFNPTVAAIRTRSPDGLQLKGAGFPGVVLKMLFTLVRTLNGNHWPYLSNTRLWQNR